MADRHIMSMLNKILKTVKEHEEILKELTEKLDQEKPVAEHKGDEE